MKESLLIIFFLIFSLGVKAQGESASTNTKAVIDFSSIKDVLKNDMLEDNAQKKLNKIKRAKKIKKQREMAKYTLPKEKSIWSFLSEYWLVKNAQALQWDFQKPDYGLEESFQSFLEKRGYLEQKFKILILNTPNIQHFALPANPNEYIFIMSLPFMRTLDLTKLEISMILFEDFLRSRYKYFKNYVSTKELLQTFGNSFYKKKLDKSIFATVLKKYDEIIFKKGFSFQQQFEVTKEMSDILKSDMKLWNIYVGLIKKIDKLIKENLLYKDYNKIYPSPELQLSWITPQEKPIGND